MSLVLVISERLPFAFRIAKAVLLGFAITDYHILVFVITGYFYVDIHLPLHYILSCVFICFNLFSALYRSKRLYIVFHIATLK